MEGSETKPEPRASGMAAVLAKLERSVAEGKYYEAQQMYKTLYYRYVGQKKADDACQLLLSGVRTMLSQRQVNEALELSKLLLDLLQSAPVKRLTIADPLGALEAMFGSWLAASEAPADTVPEALLTGFESVSKAAIKWATEQFGIAAVGQLHAIAAEFYWRVGNYSRAQRHFVRYGGGGARLAGVLADWILSGDVPADERELLITRAVLQYLSVGNLKDANALFAKFVVDSAQPVSAGPLVNFTRFLLLTLERDALPLFLTLRQRYKPALDRDPSFSKYLDQVANVFFNVPIPQPAPAGGLGGMMGELMRSFMSPAAGSHA
eukprot:TRINITY_DN10125_c0_g1_i1.p2 TRINITY_DN10125_c0_g1~~TRINITY_DN10125_c0_g1_i1.p2  ORF type:complete len:322 (+),score=129.93 TRINITY_DN10125_c0_g1_i1:52-1017(+)